MSVNIRLVLATTVLGYLTYQFPVLLYIVGPLGFYLCYKILRFSISLYRNYTTEFLVRPTIKNKPHYQDLEILGRAWDKPVAKLYKPIIEYQPREGLCAYATLNNVLLSMDRKRIQYPYIGGPLDIAGLTGFTKKILNDPLSQKYLVEPIFADNRESIERILRSQINDPQYRFMTNFLRGPLFFSDHKISIQKFILGHWSPAVAYLPEEDVVLILDVNQKYDAWLCKVDDFVDSLHTIDHLDKRTWRGLIKITLLAQISS